MSIPDYFTKYLFMEGALRKGLVRNHSGRLSSVLALRLTRRVILQDDKWGIYFLRSVLELRNK